MLYTVGMVKMDMFSRLLESEKIKYTHSGVLSSSIAIDKEISKNIFVKNNILTPKYFKYKFNKFIKKSELN